MLEALAFCWLLAEGAVCSVMRHRVLICGHSMVFWTARQARRSHFGSQLGLSDKAIIEWRGKRALRWHRLLHLLFGESQCLPPHVLVIHLGGNDLGFVKDKALVLQAIHNMRLIRERCPFITLIWSAMLPHQVWKCGCDPHILNRARRWVNNKIHNAMNGGLGFYLAHDDIMLLRPELYRADGIHPSEVGNQIFLRDLQAGVAACLASLVGDRD
ncbi:uncharacterized protein LOC121926287 isoform X1 [Sceloporus undulatus]|uniref:uncharacterized protein LOC121926287 isoform X1 n=1 Tax=Sceloporus undulatus TaxID=8520 RepID=UPI001C4AFFA3|nr:uncharacterized protein LOC121926287 isoform X1 [Sceloporus undulatus]